MSVKLSLPHPRLVNTAIPPFFIRITMAHLDHSLIAVASDALLAVPPNPDNHTVASAVRTTSGSTFTGVNVYHFSGGPCAELVALGAAAGGGVLATGIKTIVAVKKDENTEEVGVINPCGRCRQVLFDYNANMEVIVADGKAEPRSASLRELLPFAPYASDGSMEQR